MSGDDKREHKQLAEDETGGREKQAVSLML
jgi:hypothetical protein